MRRELFRRTRMLTKLCPWVSCDRSASQAAVSEVTEQIFRAAAEMRRASNAMVEGLEEEL